MDQQTMLATALSGVVAMLVTTTGLGLRAFVTGAIVTRREHTETREDRDRATRAAETAVEALRVQAQSIAHLTAAVEAATASQGEVHALVRRLAAELTAGRAAP